MPSTHTSLHYHLVFSTKDRVPYINQHFESDLQGYLGGIVKNQGGVPLAIGGIEDHMHLLVGLKSSHRLDYFLRELKAGSSGWTLREQIPEFSWQPGYAAFTVSPGNLEIASPYIRNQREHHRSKDFKAEYLDMLRPADSISTSDIFGEFRPFRARTRLSFFRPEVRFAHHCLPYLRAFGTQAANKVLGSAHLESSRASRDSDINRRRNDWAILAAEFLDCQI